MQPDENRAAISYAYRGVQTACNILDHYQLGARDQNVVWWRSSDLQDQARDNATIVPASVKQVDHAPMVPKRRATYLLSLLQEGGRVRKRESGF